MKRPNGEQIQAEIDWLKANKSKVRKHSAFEDNHHDSIDGQIRALEGRFDEDDMQREFSDEPSNVQESVRDAILWMEGEEEVSPSLNWKPLVQK
jgi:hypothetical protein